jgi:hypothetical protein
MVIWGGYVAYKHVRWGTHMQFGSNNWWKIQDKKSLEKHKSTGEDNIEMFLNLLAPKFDI